MHEYKKNHEMFCQKIIFQKVFMLNLSLSHEDSHGAFIIEKYDEYNIKWLKNSMKNYWKKVKKMFEVTYSMEGIIRKIMINVNDAVQAQSIFTNMYGSGKVQIINIRRV